MKSEHKHSRDKNVKDEGISKYAQKLLRRQVCAQGQATDYRHRPCTETFRCKTCGVKVIPDHAGTMHRNHCPNCLSSLHVDTIPGDRASTCQGEMDAVGVWVRKDGEWAIIHRCKKCGVFSSNRIASDDNQMKLMSIAVRPLSMPAFPLERLHKDDQEGRLAKEEFR